MELGAVRASLKNNGAAAPRTPAAANLPKPISTVSGRTTLRLILTR
ncbi:hypothetical protein [Aquirhabdus parva]|nr:hypothetical protein [Aquirhabdus parva]